MSDLSSSVNTPRHKLNTSDQTIIEQNARFIYLPPERHDSRVGMRVKTLSTSHNIMHFRVK